ncbi:chloride channel protein [Mucilaginibacter terrae]|uniref:CIC family chloride channel protein n=1 Tax=Mucilaginibacter terrae TaxID=1955052 RepID=A0ABU3H021_9SPHI|nr:chloride channel protein [Mucilaginibacter terrae]MDT3405221.1 CIC family chloride channel protein [Mucilaginibacter terrae]
MIKKLLILINQWRTRQPTQRNFLIYCSVLVGLVAGLASVVLKYLVHFMEELSRSMALQVPYHYSYLLLPALGILATVAYQHLINRDKMQKGIGNILMNIKRNHGNIPPDNAYAHLISSSLTVGFGGSSGLEAPIVVTGAAIGSNAGRFFKLSAYEKKVLLAAGSAAGIAAVFNSPIAGVLFALEILLGEITIPTFIPLLIASATGVVVAKLLNSQQLFHLVTEGWLVQALPFYVVLGVLSGLIAVYINKVGHGLEKGILLKYNRYTRAIAGGLMLGVLILLFPPLLGEGYHYLQSILNGNIDVLKEESLYADWLSEPMVMLLFIAALVLIKIIAAGITLGSGGNGGTFAPTMFTGAFLGLLLAYGVNQTGLIHLNTSNFIAVGMAGALSGVLHAPLTAIFLIAEITGGYLLFIPLMVVSAISYIIARLFNPHNAYWHTLIHEKDIHPDQDYSMLNTISLNTLINREYTALKRDMPVTELYTILSATNANIFAVLNANNELEGVIWMDEIRKQLFKANKPDARVEDIMVNPPALISYNQPVSSVMNVFDNLDVWQLPVIQNGKFIGFVSKSGLLNQYRQVIIQQHKDADLFARS